MVIEMPRGDIRPVNFSIENPDEEIDIVFDEIYFTVKSSFTARKFLFQKRLSTGEIELMEDGSYQFTIQPEDTDSLSIGKYVFDLEVIYGTTVKQTFVGELRLTNEVTFAENEV